MPKGHWCDVIVNARAPTKDKRVDIKSGFYEKLEFQTIP
jgi:hypothetical protein